MDQLSRLMSVFSKIQPHFDFRSVWKKTFFNREKKREVMFRTKLMDKVRAAEKFDAEVC